MNRGTEEQMIVRIVTIQVKKDFIEQFETETRLNHEGSVREPGVLRFDVLRDPETLGSYVLYEVYRDQEANEAHKHTSHYARWKKAVQEWMVTPRASTAYEVIAPDMDRF